MLAERSFCRLCREKVLERAKSVAGAGGERRRSELYKQIMGFRSRPVRLLDGLLDALLDGGLKNIPKKSDGQPDQSLG
jgi:hypothetical protein